MATGRGGVLPSHRIGSFQPGEAFGEIGEDFRGYFSAQAVRTDQARESDAGRIIRLPRGSILAFIPESRA